MTNCHRLGNSQIFFDGSTPGVDRDRAAGVAIDAAIVRTTGDRAAAVERLAVARDAGIASDAARNAAPPTMELRAANVPRPNDTCCVSPCT